MSVRPPRRAEGFTTFASVHRPSLPAAGLAWPPTDAHARRRPRPFSGAPRRGLPTPARVPLTRPPFTPWAADTRTMESGVAIANCCRREPMAIALDRRQPLSHDRRCTAIGRERERPGFGAHLLRTHLRRPSNLHRVRCAGPSPREAGASLAQRRPWRLTRLETGALRKPGSACQEPVPADRTTNRRGASSPVEPSWRRSRNDRRASQR